MILSPSFSCYPQRRETHLETFSFSSTSIRHFVFKIPIHQMLHPGPVSLKFQLLPDTTHQYTLPHVRNDALSIPYIHCLRKIEDCFTINVHSDCLSTLSEVRLAGLICPTQKYVCALDNDDNNTCSMDLCVEFCLHSLASDFCRQGFNQPYPW